MYVIVERIAGQESDGRIRRASTKRDARSIAYRAASRLRPPHVTARPTWCEGVDWFPHDSYGAAVGGYDVNDDGSAVIVYRGWAATPRKEAP